MEILKRISSLALFLLVPLTMMGNKGCEGKSMEHPYVSRNADCAECHEGQGKAVDKKPEWHNDVFSREHGKEMHRFGFKTDTYCAVCHDQKQCTSCHQIEKPRSHTQFFRLKGHALEVGMDRTRCSNCHKVDFCESCHKETKPMSHMGAWGSPGNNHCLNCHYPASSAGAEGCRVCHSTLPSHSLQPRQPANAFHGPGADCRNCHFPLRHPDNGTACVVCHTR